MMMFLKSLGEAITKGINKAVTLCENRVLKNPLECRMQVKITIVSLMCVWIIMCFCSFMTACTDGHNFLDSFYTWFITFSTIGYGDFVPFAAMESHVASGKKTRASLVVIQVLSTVPVMIGICMVAAFLSSVLDLITQIKFSEIFMNDPRPHRSIYDSVDPVSQTALAAATAMVPSRRNSSRRRRRSSV